MTQTSDPARQDGSYYSKLFLFCQDFFENIFIFLKKNLLFLHKKRKIGAIGA